MAVLRQPCPLMPGETVTVKQGDTLQSIANRLGVDLNDLMAATEIKTPNKSFFPARN